MANVSFAMVIDFYQQDADGDGVAYGALRTWWSAGWKSVGSVTCMSGYCPSDAPALGEHDNCPTVTNPTQLDSNSNGIGDVCEGAAFDNDSDGLHNAIDNCPNDANANQLDTDGDGKGDACDPDVDNDGVANSNDKFPSNAAASIDTDGDRVPDSWNTSCDAACQATSNLTLDNCPLLSNANQWDADGDGIGDACDNDDDNDGVLDSSDTFPLNAAAAVDTDGDGKPDSWLQPNLYSCAANATTCNGLTLDDDNDNHGVLNASDNCPTVGNTNQSDYDHNGIGDACDANTDRDKDTLPDLWEIEHGRNPNVADYAINTNCQKDENG